MFQEGGSGKQCQVWINNKETTEKNFSGSQDTLMLHSSTIYFSLDSLVSSEKSAQTRFQAMEGLIDQDLYTVWKIQIIGILEMQLAPRMRNLVLSG